MRKLFGGRNSFANPMFGNNPLGNMANLMQKYNQFRSDPFGALMGMGFNVPQNLQNNPEAMVNYLRNSGQMNNQQFEQLSQLAMLFQNGMK